MLSPVYPFRPWAVKVRWTKPIEYDSAKDWCKADGKAHFYIILGKKGRSLKLFYVGKTYRSEVWLRLRSKDHLRRWQTLRKKYPSYKLLVSRGILNLPDWYGRMSSHYPKERIIDSIESLLIYANYKQKSLINRSKRHDLRLSDQFIITNSGFYKPLFRRLIWTLFVENGPPKS